MNVPIVVALFANFIIIVLLLFSILLPAYYHPKCLIEKINISEGITYIPYYDVAGVLTVCYGHTGHDIKKDKVYTLAECQYLLERGLLTIETEIRPLIQAELSDIALAALFSFAHNVGTHSFAQSTLLKKLNAGQKTAACEELRQWIYAGGKPWKGLITRRQIEEMMCLAAAPEELIRYLIMAMSACIYLTIDRITLL